MGGLFFAERVSCQRGRTVERLCRQAVATKEVNRRLRTIRLLSDRLTQLFGLEAAPACLPDPSLKPMKSAW